MRTSSSQTITLIFITGIFLKPAFSKERVIYGEDNRMDVALHANLALRSIAPSVAARIPKLDLPFINGEYQLPTKTLKEYMEVCSDERFSTQRVAAQCTGFLIGEDILVTAGHCMRDDACKQNYWAFDYLYTSRTLAPDQVFECQKVIAQVFDVDLDYAIIQLSKVPLGRAPLKFRKAGIISAAEDLAVIGHPWGLPMKIDDGGIVRDIKPNEPYFVTELDTYGGNSGSPVVNVATMEVEGILVRGEIDYEFDDQGSCYRSKVCPTGTCTGEEVTKITSLPLSALKL